MKALMLILVLFLAATTAFAAPTPHTEAQWNYFKQLENGEVLNGESVQKVLRYEYSFSSTAASGSTIVFPNKIPPGAVIHKVTMHIPTVIVSVSDNTIALTCESSGDLLAAVDLTDDTIETVRFGVPKDNSATSGVWSDGCTPQYDIGVGTTGITAGRIITFIHFLIGE